MDSGSILENISAIYQRISHAAMRAGRDPEKVKLIAVTKTIGVKQIREAADAGLRIFGENRVQEAQKKISHELLQLPGERLEWHLIGHLQRNKAKYAVSLFNLIHSVDSLALAEELNRHTEKIAKVQDILVEVKLSSEETKHGVGKSGLLELLERLSFMKNLRLRGLMTMPPFTRDPEGARHYFRELGDLRNRAEAAGFPLPELSMGMSHDFEVAVEEGATMVRIGTAIFGERP